MEITIVKAENVEQFRTAVFRMFISESKNFSYSDIENMKREIETLKFVPKEFYQVGFNGEWIEFRTS